MSKHNIKRGLRDIGETELKGYKAYLHLNVNVEVKQWLAKIAKERGLSVSTLCDDILSDWIEKQE